MVGLQARQSPTFVKAKQMIESGQLGKILGSSMYGHGTIFGATVPESLTYGLPVEAGANLVTIPFGHTVDVMCFVLGEFASLQATLANHRPQLMLVDAQGNEKGLVSKTAHDHVSITGTLVSGAVADVTYAGGLSRTGRDFFWEIVGTEGSLVFEGGKMGGHVQMFEPVMKFVREGADELEVVHVEKSEAGPIDFSMNVGRAWDAFAGQGREKGLSVTTFEDAVVRHKMIEAIYRSAENGTRESYL